MNYFNVNIPVPVVAAGYQLPSTEDTSATDFTYHRVGKDILSPEFVAWLATKGFAPREQVGSLLFYAPRGARTSVHVDAGTVHQWALNVALGEAVQVFWHAPLTEGEQKSNDLNYTKYPADSPVVEETTIGLPTVCRIGVPHSSYSPDADTWLLSIRLTPERLGFPFVQAMFNR